MKTKPCLLATLLTLGVCACSSPPDVPADAELPRVPSNPSERDTESVPLGGQSGNEGAAVPPPCIGAGETVVVALVERLESGCGELRVDRVVTSSADEPPVVGDRLGGAVQRPFTVTLPAIGELALAVWSAPGEDCQLQLDCSAAQCGAQPDGDADLAAWDGCNSSCLESTRAECDALRQAEIDSGRYALGGTVRLAPLDAAGDARVDWRGATRSVPIEQLLAEDCDAYFAALPSAGDGGEPAASADGAPPPVPATAATCPLPSE